MIRPALPTDAPAIAHVHVRSWQAAYASLMPAAYLASLDQSLPQRETYWAGAITQGDAQVFVAEIDGEVVGWLSAGGSRDEDADKRATGEIMAIYLLAEHWREGLGRGLWEAGVRWLADQGYQQSTLWVLAANTRAIEFYQRMGWTAQPDSLRTLRRGGVSLEEIRFHAPA
ncbi:GNAT family N-acetyltransferase [Pseudomonas sp. App30]|uniref:GNAT family N-acetyltransferase n=1 Tax=Pseudomonas sp. App30 TaxID=3068990 RepID=UPI003A806894